MQRRGFLATAAGLAGTALAGCVGSGSGAGAGDGDDGETTTDLPTDTTVPSDGPGDDDGTPSPDGETATPSPNPRVVETIVERTGTSCANEDTGTAAINFGNLAVTVTGTLRAATPCHLPAIHEAGYDAAADTYRVTLEPVDDPEKEVCIECVGAIEYALDVTFEGDLPGTVEVAHRDGDRTAVVASRERPEM